MKKTLKQFAYSSLIWNLLLVFAASHLQTPAVYANSLSHLPAVGTLITPTDEYTPTLINGLLLQSDNPLRLEFLISAGEDQLSAQQLQQTSKQLIKYFMASLTVPDDELWVNLSPNEQNRIISRSLGDTEMGRDLLSQDYMLKQLTASLLHPDQPTGKQFWKEFLSKHPLDSQIQELSKKLMHKIWIVPQDAVVYETQAGAYVIDSHLTVMLEKDFTQDNRSPSNETEDFDTQLTDLIRNIILPAIEKEVNQGKNFSQLRQIYQSMILATWYKMSLKDSLLSQVYVNQGKTQGIDITDKEMSHKIYDQYMSAFTKGVYNFVKEDIDPITQRSVPRQYFSGGMIHLKRDDIRIISQNESEISKDDQAMISQYVSNTNDTFKVTTDLLDIGSNADQAVISDGEGERLSNEQIRRILERNSNEIFLPINLDQEIKRLNAELSMLGLDPFDEFYSQSMNAYKFIDSIPKGGFKGGHILGLDTWQHTYEALADISGLTPWQDTYQDLFGDESTHKDEFLEHITDKATKSKPIFVLVPRDIFSHPMNEDTATELRWFLDNPERTKHVHFVFGAYNMTTPSQWHSSSLSNAEQYTRPQRDQLYQHILLNHTQHKDTTLRNTVLEDPEEIVHRTVFELQHSFEEYYSQFKRMTSKAIPAFRERDWVANYTFGQMRFNLHETLTGQMSSVVAHLMGNYIEDKNMWKRIRQTLQGNYVTQGDSHKLNLALNFIDEIRSIVTDVPIQSPDPNFEFSRGGKVNSFENVLKYPVTSELSVKENLRAILVNTDVGDLFGDIETELEVIQRILEMQLAEMDVGVTVQSFDVIQPMFYRNKAAYIVGRINTSHGSHPMVIPLKHPSSGIVTDAILIGTKSTRNILLSSTRSAFFVNAPFYGDIVQFISELYPEVSVAQAYGLLGHNQRSEHVYLGQLHDHLDNENQLEHLGEGSQSIVFASDDSNLILKVVRDKTPNSRVDILANYQSTHQTNRHGQLLDTWQYHNAAFPKHMFSDELLERFRTDATYDVTITDTEVIFSTLFAQRRVTSVPDVLKEADPQTKLDILIKVGWNIKHLAAMGIVPTDMHLDHFGVTSWGRVVYMNNAGISQLEHNTFLKAPEYIPVEVPVQTEQTQDNIAHYYIYPELLLNQIDIPHGLGDEFKRIHGDLYTLDYWNSMRWRMRTNQLPDMYPYPNRYRTTTHRMKMMLENMGITQAIEDEDQLSATPTLEVSESTMHGLKFLELQVPNPRARILVVEPIGPDIISLLHSKMGNVNFDILQPDSELVEDDLENWVPGVHGKLKDLAQEKHYDYVLGYVNEAFDEEFFEAANLKGLLLFSTGVHNIDLDAATANNTVVTNAPGPTTVAVAEQNIGLMLDTVFSNEVTTEISPYRSRLTEILKRKDGHFDSVAQIIWYQLMKETLKLDEMFAFGVDGRYVRTGVGSEATVYHDQLGQNQEANIHTSLGIIGLDEIGERLIEYAIAHEVSTIYVLDEEYDQLDYRTKERFQKLIKHIEKDKANFDVHINIKAIPKELMQELSDYTIASPHARNNRDLTEYLDENTVTVDPLNIFVRNDSTLDRSIADLNVGIQGLGRIGKAVAQRVISFGGNVLVNQRNPEREQYERKSKFLNSLATILNGARYKRISDMVFLEMDELFLRSNILTTLTPLTDETYGWIEEDHLENFGEWAEGDVRAIVSQVKNIFDEQALLKYLRSHPNVEVRLDVVNQEEKGDAHRRFRDTSDKPLRNIKVAGHTAAAVPEVRRLKVQRALDNLDYIMNDQIPPNILNSEVMSHIEEDIELAGLQFLRMTSDNSKAKVLVVEPLNPDIQESLSGDFPDVDFDIIQMESEVIEVDGRLIAGIDPNIDQIVSENDYDFCVGYCNTRFDEEFFEEADLKGLVLFATAEHHIDLDAATKHETLVTTAPGPTTIAVAEQNLALALDGLYGNSVHDIRTRNSKPLSDLKPTTKSERLAMSHIMWYALLKKALKLDEMFEFGQSGNYAKTGVSSDSTVYHDQIGQNNEAGIETSIGILGLQTTGVNLLETAIIHQVSEIYVLKSEFEKLATSTQQRIYDLIETIESHSEIKDVSISLILTEERELINDSNYILKTPTKRAYHRLEDVDSNQTHIIDANYIFVSDYNILDQSMAHLNFAVHGIRRIGTAVAKRALAFGVNLLIDTGSLDTRDLDKKHEAFSQIAESRQKVYGSAMQAPAYVDKEVFFNKANIFTTLGNSSREGNFEWVDEESLQQFGLDAKNLTRIIVNASKYQVDEDALVAYAKEHPGVQIRLDVLNDEGVSQQKFLDRYGRQFANVKLSGHTAAAVWEVRKLKISRALTNLRRLIDGRIPNHILNPDVLAAQRADDNNPDKAMTASEQGIKKVGGINLNPQLLDLQIKRDDLGIPLPVHQQPLNVLKIQGFLPVIIQIQPISNLPLLLGIKEETEKPLLQQKVETSLENSRESADRLNLSQSPKNRIIQHFEHL